MKVELDFSEDTLPSLRQAPEVFASQLRLAAAAKWYELGRISQGKAAEIAGLSRAEFIEELGRMGIPAIQTTVEELRREVEQ